MDICSKGIKVGWHSVLMMPYSKWDLPWPRRRTTAFLIQDQPQRHSAACGAFLYYARLQCKLCVVWRKLMSELESRLQKQFSAAPDCSLVIRLKLGLALHRELITVFSKTTNIVIRHLFPSPRVRFWEHILVSLLRISVLCSPSDMLQVQVYDQVFDAFLSNFQTPELKQLNPGSIQSTTELSWNWFEPLEMYCTRLPQIQSWFGDHHPPYSVRSSENRRCYSSVQS